MFNIDNCQILNSIHVGITLRNLKNIYVGTIVIFFGKNIDTKSFH